MITAPMLQLIREAGESVMLMTDGVQRDELLRSRLTRAETCRQLLCIANTLADAAHVLRPLMPEIDWAGWQATRRALQPGTQPSHPQATHDDALWFAATSLVPATLSWLAVYRQSHPSLFDSWG